MTYIVMAYIVMAYTASQVAAEDLDIVAAILSELSFLEQEHRARLMRKWSCFLGVALDSEPLIAQLIHRHISARDLHRGSRLLALLNAQICQILPDCYLYLLALLRRVSCWLLWSCRSCHFALTSCGRLAASSTRERTALAAFCRISAPDTGCI